tara:strand:- start:335 stop:544 length:210 start_codon:yes stop_codon:yes gene_type:complete
MKMKYYCRNCEDNIDYNKELIELKEYANTLFKAVKAGKAFIDSRVADPDITDEMADNYCDYLEVMSKLT